MIEKKIAEKIRKARKSRGLTLSQVGELTGLSKGLLSKIENNRVSPPIATLSKIARGLRVSISTFFEDDGTEQKGCAVIRRNGRKEIPGRWSNLGFTYLSLTSFRAPHVIEPFIVKFPPINKKPRVLFDHPGEEFVFVLKGEMEFVHGKEKIRLSPGDAVHFDPSIPHRGQNAGKDECECLSIVIDR